MCGLGENIRKQSFIEGKLEGQIKTILDMMKNFNLSLDQILEGMDSISEEEKINCKNIILNKDYLNFSS